jgi:hypothetical protein
MVIWERVMADLPPDLLIRVPRALGAELPDGPAIAVFRVEEGDEAV